MGLSCWVLHRQNSVAFLLLVYKHDAENRKILILKIICIYFTAKYLLNLFRYTLVLWQLEQQSRWTCLHEAMSAKRPNSQTFSSISMGLQWNFLIYWAFVNNSAQKKSIEPIPKIFLGMIQGCMHAHLLGRLFFLPWFFGLNFQFWFTVIWRYVCTVFI